MSLARPTPSDPPNKDTQGWSLSLSKGGGCSHHYHGWYHTAPAHPREVRVTHLQIHRVSSQIRPRLRPHKSQTLNPKALQGHGILAVIKKIMYCVIVSIFSELIGPMLPPNTSQSILARHHSRAPDGAVGQRPGESELREAPAVPSMSHFRSFGPWPCSALWEAIALFLLERKEHSSCQHIWSLLISTSRVYIINYK